MNNNFKNLEISKPEISKSGNLEIAPEFVRNAEMALQNFIKLKPEEKVLILSDEKTDIQVAGILKQAIANLGSAFREEQLTEKTSRSKIQELLREFPVLLDISHGSYEALEGLLDEDIKQFGNRVAVMIDLDREAFKDGGAISEKLEDLESRLNKMEAVLKRATGFRIKSRYGTDLEIKLRSPGERRWYKDTGVIDKPGKWDNLPGGEIYATPDETGTNGILVLPVLESMIAPEQGVDEFVWLTIRNGKISSIQGGESAKKLREKLNEKAKEEMEESGQPVNVYQIAEIAFGANSRARSTVSDPDQSYNYPAVSIVEAEKRFGTIHIAFGDTKHGEEGVEGFVTSVSHYDFVIPRAGLTVEMFVGEEDFAKKENSRILIRDGSLNFF